MFDSSLKVRIPPSPTGPLHLGTVRTALYNFLLAKKHGGTFVFRLEDTDRERSKSEYVSDIINGFRWLGITWDEGPLRQSEHKARHQMVVKQLIGEGLAYECFCTTEELNEIRQSQRAQNLVEGYDNRHRGLTEEQKKNFREQGRKPVIRFRLPDNKELFWDDLIRGRMTVNTSDLGGDPVIAKDNGDVLYNFAVVVDDNDAGINCVIRGEDHLHNTAKQIALYEGLNWKVPKFGHVSLILTTNREKLSKRKHGDIAGITKYINEGYLPEAIVNYLIGMSWTYPGDDSKEIFTIDEVIPIFSLDNVSKSSAVYDLGKLHWFCKEHFKLTSSEEVLKRAEPFLEKENISLNEYSIEEKLKIISLIKDGLITLSEIPQQVKVFCKIPDLSNLEIKEKECLDDPNAKLILEKLKDLLNESDSLNEEQQVKDLLEKLSSETGIKKGKKLFWPVRVAISGTVHGPDLTSMLSILGLGRVKDRIERVNNFLMNE
ncbi:MAG: glutamate--tRNA ligase [Candidatus Caenarcaniphilales bacterium]|nr:glutamate--tRNA ligase [Candidatus Caenarcaniphilales bacterium]